MKSFLYVILFYLPIYEVEAKDIYDTWAYNLVHASSVEKVIKYNRIALEKIKLEKFCLTERKLSIVPLHCQKLVKIYGVKMPDIEDLCLNGLEKTDNLYLLKEMRSLLDKKSQCIKPLTERILDIEYQNSDHIKHPLRWREKTP